MTTQCKSGMFLQTPRGSIEEAYSVSTHSSQRSSKGATQWSEGEIRAKYWVIGGRSLVQSIVLKCVTCRRFEGRPFNAPSAPPLPSFRVNETPPFAYTAVDFAGPMAESRTVAKCGSVCLPVALFVQSISNSSPT